MFDPTKYVRPHAAMNGGDISVFVLYDSVDGTKLAEYEPDSGNFGTLGCTDWRGNFTFLSRNDDDQPVMLTVAVR